MRIGINVPNELLQRVKAIRPEVNVSQVCREALESRAALAERAKEQACADGMDMHAPRLAESDRASMVEPDWAGMALEDARDWVRGANPDLWFELWQEYDELQGEGQDTRRVIQFWSGAVRDPEYFDVENVRAKRFGDRRNSNEDWLFQPVRRGSPAVRARVSQTYDSLLQEAEDKYFNTWTAYVLEVRRMMDDYLKSERERQRVERQGKFQAGWTPELPPQMVEYYEL